MKGKEGANREPENLGSPGLIAGIFRPTLFAVLPKSEEGQYDPVSEARKRLDAVDLLTPSVEALARIRDDEDLRTLAGALARLRTDFEGALEVAKEVEAEMGSLGIRVDPDTAGAATWNRGDRGPPPSFLTVHVRNLLLSRFPEWDGKPPFPGRNTQELRDWLRGEIIGPGWWANPWKPEEIDASPKGPLYRLVSNLQRLQ